MDLTDIYQQTILDHKKNPRNFGSLDDATNSAEGYNPLCGDKYRINLKVQDSKIEKISFEGDGCAISTAAASIMTELVKDKSKQEAASIIDSFLSYLKGDDIEIPAKLEIFSGVKDLPVRIKCANLPWHALKAALEEKDMAVTTE